MKKNNISANKKFDLCYSRKNANENGITLIALIVTIIVLLILAGITINLTIKDGGIIQRSKDAVSLHIYSQAEEEAKLEGANLMAQRYENHEISLAESAQQASTDLKVDSNAKKGWVEVKPNESENAIYVTYKDSKLLEGKKSSQAGKAIFKINLSDGSITPNPDLPSKDPDPTPTEGISIDMVASDITSESIIVTVTESGNGKLDTPEYTYYLNGEQKGDPTNSNTYTYTDLTPDTTYTLKVSTNDKNGNNVEKEIKATTSKEETSDTVEKHIEDIQVGDYVNYTPPAASYTVAAENSGYTSDQTFDNSNSANSAMNTWRVWKVDKTNNTIEIVSSTNTYKSLYLIGATGYNQGPTIINSICSKLYSNQKNYIVARSIDEEDIQEAMEENWGIYRKTDLNKFITKLQTYYSASVLYNSEEQIAHSYVPNCYDTDDIENLQNYDLRPSKNETKGYTERDKLKCKNTYYYLSGDNFSESIGSLKYSIIGNDRGSWLASRSVEVRDHLVYFRIRTFVSSNGGFFGSYLCYSFSDRSQGSYGLSPLCDIESSCPISYVKTDSSTGYNIWKID